MIGALFRLVFSNVLGNLWRLVRNLVRLLRQRPKWVELLLSEPLTARPPHVGRFLAPRGSSLARNIFAYYSLAAQS